MIEQPDAGKIAEDCTHSTTDGRRRLFNQQPNVKPGVAIPHSFGNIMCYIITDRKLEDLPGFESEERRIDAKRTIAHGCVRLERVEDDFFKRYIHGFGDFQELLNRTLHTEGIRWHVYIPAKHRLNEIPILLLFVYGYLEEGGRIVIYDQCGMVQFHPEVPVASVDVTLKVKRHTPIDLAWLEKDVIYHFHRSGPYAFRHDTGLLIRMGTDEPCFKPSYAGFKVSGRMTVGELASVVGNSVGMLSVYDYDRAMESMAVNCDPDTDEMVSVRFEPIEVIMTDDARRNASEREYEGHITNRLETSEEVVMYAPLLGPSVPNSSASATDRRPYRMTCSPSQHS